MWGQATLVLGKMSLAIALFWKGNKKSPGIPSANVSEIQRKSVHVESSGCDLRAIVSYIYHKFLDRSSNRGFVTLQSSMDGE